MTNELLTIDFNDEIDRQRYVCPTCGGRSWEATNHHFWCKNCARAIATSRDAEPEFDELLNLKTNERVAREEVKLVGEGYQMHHSGGLPPTADS